MTRARKKNPLRTDPMTDFFALLRDPNPESMQIAQDLIEESQLTLTQVSEAGEVFIPPNLSNEIAISKMSGAEWLDHVSNSPARGYFNLTPVDHPDKHSHVGVAWAIQRRTQTITFEGDPRTLEMEEHIGALYIAWGRETWIETDKGITRYTGSGSFDRKTTPWFFEELAGFPKPDLFSNNVRPRLVKAAWRIAKVLHGYDSELSDTKATEIMQAIRADFMATGLRADKSIPADIVPMDDRGAGRRPPPRAPSTRINPGAARTWSNDEILSEFRTLIAEPDPASMQIAADLLEQTERTIWWASETIWREEEIWSAGIGSAHYGSHIAVETHGAKIYKAGFLPLSPHEQDALSVGWTVLEAHDAQRRVTRYVPQLQIAFRGTQWIETIGGPSMPVCGTRRMASRAFVDDVHMAAPILPQILEHGSGSPDDVIVPELVRVAWAVAVTLKRLSRSQLTPPSKVDIELVVEAVHRYQQADLPPSSIVFGPAAVGPGDMKPNPPWVTHTLADAFESLSSQIPPAYLPKLDDVHGGPQGTLVAQLKEYGCGVYGCVLPTLDDQVVLKVTTDDTEAQFASQFAAELAAPICVEYYMAVSLAQKHEGRPIYLLWREAADDVGDIDRVAGQAAEDALSEQHRAAQVAYLAIRKKLDAKRPLLEWEVACEKMGKVKELRLLAKGMLEVYRKQKIFFGDIHAGNIGRVFRGGEHGMWVITDPGHVVVLT